MFGYIRPLKCELKCVEYDAYKAVYCGLCHALARRYGFACRFLINYDFTFLAMLLHDPAPPRYVKKRCPADPLRKRCVLDSDASLYAAADLSVILYHRKLLDGIRDERGFKSLLYRAAALLLRGAYKKAAAHRPDYAAEVDARLAELSALEAENNPSLDAAADKFALLLSAAARSVPTANVDEGTPDPAAATADNRALRELLYHIGRKVYVLDAVNDLSDDFAARKYNPLVPRFKLTCGALPGDDALTLERTLSHSLARVQAAFGLLPETPYGSIIQNTISLGIPQITELVFKGEFNGSIQRSWRITRRE